jgi:hypothetical protein
MRRASPDTKIRRNDPCWCGSGLKFKKCHLHRSEQNPEHPANFSKKFFLLQKKKFCLCNYDKANCSSTFSASHTISKSGSLKRIAEESHLSKFEGDFQFVDPKAFADTFHIARVSVNRASTFYGFCSFHDGTLFRELDLLKLDDLQLFLWQVFYRSVAFEVYQKRVALAFTNQVRLLDKGAGVREQRAIQFEADVQEYSHQEGLAGISTLLTSLEELRSRSVFSDIIYACYVTDRLLPFAGVGCFQPCRDVNGKFLQRVNLILREELFRSTRRPESVCIAAIPMQSATLLCLVTLRQYAKAVEYVDAFRLSVERTVSTFFGMMMLQTESVFFAPSFLTKMEEKRRRVLRTLSSLGVNDDLTAAHIGLGRSVDEFDDVQVVKCMAQSTELC